MRYVIFFLLTSLVFSCTKREQPLESNLDLVNPYIGTTGHHPTEYGGTMPSVASPFAMTQWCAMTRVNQISRMPYHYDDTAIIGFIGSHQPAVWMGDYGYVSVMPFVGKLTKEVSYRFRHEDEEVSPFRYFVRMNTSDNRPLSVTLAATERCALLSFVYPESDSSNLRIDASRLEGFSGYIQVDREKGEITGYNPDRHSAAIGPVLKNFKGYFIIQLKKKIIGTAIYQGDSIIQGIASGSGDNVGAIVSFQTREGEEVLVKMATSFISIEQARENLEKEIADWDTKTIINNTREQWEDLFSRIQVEGGDDNQRVSFYSALYHCLQYPRIFSEYGRYYSAFDDTIHAGESYNDYSLWDTYRALHPLLILLVPERVNPMIQALVNMYKEGGWLPKWPNPTYTNIMIGTHADGVIADAFVKGFRDYETETAYEAMYKNAMTPPDGDSTNRWTDRAPWTSYEARGGLSWYKKLGYVSIDITNEAVSRTIEFSYGDYCVAQVAKEMGKEEDHGYFLQRSQNYKNTYNPETRMVAPRKVDGTFHRVKHAGFTEGSPWTYLFGAMHDVPGMIDMMGGKETFEQRLDENFDSLHYKHDNEPGHHYIYLYNYIDRYRKTQDLLWKHTAVNYQNKPDGLSGNDDCGQMSAWLVFTSMGLYPVCPGSGEYALGVPMFERITLDLRKPLADKKLVIVARGLSPKAKYVNKVTLDGKELDKPFVKHEDLIKADSLVFYMGE